MLYLFHGTDKMKSKDKATALVSGLVAKKPEVSKINLDKESFSESLLEEAMGSQGLFERRLIVVAEGLLSEESVRDVIVRNISKISESENIFIFIEGKLLKSVTGKLEKWAEKILESDAPSKGRQFAMGEAGNLNSKEFNVFVLTDAFGNRDRKRLWILYQKAVALGVPAEEINGLLFWQIKSMVLASEAKSAIEAGLAPYTFTKAKGFLRNYSVSELKKMMSGLISLYHNSRRGVHDFSIALERFILSN